MFALKFFQIKRTLIDIIEFIQEKNLLPCQVCDRKFARKSALVQHQATHSNVRSFKCSICPEGRCFKTKSQLINHMVYHYEPKFACSHCDYKTHTRGNLKRHEKLHEKSKS